MININGKEWNEVIADDIVTLLSDKDLDETFFFEFKSNDVNSNGLAKEISAFSNTYGGYIFIGVSDDKQVEGAPDWSEQRIHTIIYDCLSPVPIFDIKRFTIDAKTLFVIRIEEGTEPPYVTNKGLIYERVSSGSFPIKDSNKLSQLFYRKEQNEQKVLDAISIPEPSHNVNNIYGYIDVGFALYAQNRELLIDKMANLNVEELCNKVFGETGFNGYSLNFIGSTLLYTINALSTPDAPNMALPAHLNNFIEIMPDGSAKMRYLLINNNPDDHTVNTWLQMVLAFQYEKLYSTVFETELENRFICAKKYSELTVFKQFSPKFHVDDSFLGDAHWVEKNEKYLEAFESHRRIAGQDIVITDERWPRSGLKTIDKRWVMQYGKSYSMETLVSALFSCPYLPMGNYYSESK